MFFAPDYQSTAIIAAVASFGTPGSGVLASSLQQGTFLLRGWKAMQWRRSRVGGLFMGLGSALIPGGNDTAILVLIPTLLLQALVGFLSMLAGVASILILMCLHK